MGFAKIYSRACVGIDAPLVTIEVHLANGIPCFTLVGLPETTVREARERVRSAIIQSGFEFPARRITINLAPADLPKHGARFDLAIAIGILIASEQLQPKANGQMLYEYFGELSLQGSIRPVPALLPALIAAKHAERVSFIPTDNANEASLFNGSMSLCCASLNDCINHIIGSKLISPVDFIQQQPETSNADDIADVQGQLIPKRALLIAASGLHNVLFVGPPGTGKSMLAKRFCSLLPPLDDKQAIESAAIYSLSQQGQPPPWRQRPFRCPHHSSSLHALLGGGAFPQPGEISLAHNGVLFLDELPEFGRKFIDALREPLETQDIHLSRAAYKIRLPAKFQLIAAMNPSPTGDLHDRRTTNDQILRYLNRVSGPLLDRIDIQAPVARQPLTEESTVARVTSQTLAQQVRLCQSKQQGRQGCLNGELSVAQIEQHCKLSADDNVFLIDALERLNASHRRFHKVLKVARTIADLDDKTQINRSHIAEALSYRALDSMIQQLANC